MNTTLVLKDHQKTLLYFIGVVTISVFFLSVEPPVVFNEKNWDVIFIFSLAVYLWITQFIPLPATSLLVVTLLISLNVGTPEVVFSSFANNTIFFLIGAFMLGGAIQSSGICERFVIRIIRIVGTSPHRIFTVFYLLSLFASFVIQAHVVVTVLIPVVNGFSRIIKREFPKTKFPKLLLISIAWGAIIGSLGTLLGSGRAPLSNTLFSQYYNQDILFFEWAIVGIPLALLLGSVGYGLLRFAIPIDVETVQTSFIRALVTLKKKQSNSSQIFISIVFLFTLVLWVFASDTLGNATIAFIGVLILVGSKQVSWKTLEHGINWEIIFIFGGSIALGSALVDTQALSALTQELSPVSSETLLWLGSLVSLFGTELITNSAVITTFLPVGLELSENILHAKQLTFSMSFTAGIGILTPMSTPGMAMILSTKDVSIKDVFKIGILFKTVAFVLINIYLTLLFIWG